jgi:hypothetical protein
MVHVLVRKIILRTSGKRYVEEKIQFNECTLLRNPREGEIQKRNMAIFQAQAHYSGHQIFNNLRG